MQKITNRFENIRFPLITLLIVSLLRGLSGTILSNNIQLYIQIDNQIILDFARIFDYFSGIVLDYLPMIFAIKILSKEHDSARPAIMFIVAYFLFIVVTMVIGTTTMPAVAYDNSVSISDNIQLVGNTSLLMAPYRTGFISALVVGLLVNFAYVRSRARSNYGFLSFVDKDTFALIISLIITLFTAMIFTYIWPFVISMVFQLFEWIANDIANPISMFVYGLIDKIFTLFDISIINRQTFWYESFGGSWMNDIGNNFVGDVSVWQEQIKYGIFNSGFGRFITPYYITNLFAIPAAIIAVYRRYTDKRERSKFFIFVMVLIVFSLITDLSFPLELFLLFTAPLLFTFHVFISASLFAICQGFGISLGLMHVGSIATAPLGNGVDLISFLRNPELVMSVIAVVIIGIIVGILYIFAFRIYYTRMAIGLINKNDIQNHVNELIEIVGGLDNISEIESSPFRVDVVLKRPQLFDYAILETTNIKRVIETRGGYALYYGTASTMLRQEILRQQKDEEE